MDSEMLHSLKLLLIEDNRDLRETLCYLFEIMGHAVESADNGVDGISKAKAFHPDVIFCDIGLPGVNGYDVARSVRNDPVFRDVFMVALSGYTGQKEITASIESGFDRHLGKPVGIDTLKKLLAEVSMARG